MIDNFQDKLEKKSRSKIRNPASEGASISFKPPGGVWEYQIKLRELSDSGLGLLVKQDSDLLKQISVGDVFTVNYHEDSVPMTVQHQTVQVRHISFPPTGIPENHMVIGLRFLEPDDDQ
jgi:hypothetical protein